MFFHCYPSNCHPLYEVWPFPWYLCSNSFNAPMDIFIPTLINALKTWAWLPSAAFWSLINSSFHFSVLEASRIHFYQVVYHHLSSFTTHHYLPWPFLCLIHHLLFLPLFLFVVISDLKRTLDILTHHCSSSSTSLTFNSSNHRLLMNTVISWIFT